jgi:hypothetical protein
MKASELQTGDIIKMLDLTSCKIIKFEERYNDNVCERMKILVQKCDNPEQSFYIYPTPDEKIHFIARYGKETRVATLIDKLSKYPRDMIINGAIDVEEHGPDDEGYEPFLTIQVGR